MKTKAWESPDTSKRWHINYCVGGGGIQARFLLFGVFHRPSNEFFQKSTDLQMYLQTQVTSFMSHLDHMYNRAYRRSLTHMHRDNLSLYLSYLFIYNTQVFVGIELVVQTQTQSRDSNERGPVCVQQNKHSGA